MSRYIGNFNQCEISRSSILQDFKWLGFFQLFGVLVITPVVLCCLE